MRYYICLIFFVFIIGSAAYAYDNDDFQVWNTEVEEVKLNKNTRLALEEEMRFGDNANEFYYHHYDLGISYSLKKWLSIGGGYRHVYELKKGKFKQENEPYAIIGFSWDWRGFKFDDRNRFEYRHFDYQMDRWRFRNKFTVKLPWKFTKMEINPYLSDEIYVDLNKEQMAQNRFYSGLGFNLTKNIKGEIYYLLQHTKTQKGIYTCWPRTNVLGTKIRFSF